ncbi:leucine-rich repeat extensin-like protein 6 [Lolium rigidum]|uniref:leucine-rich repeat extensin-like protein 6 n=1 Tax=Lolium rigidum TaxID=89674 RepID=UPI001F5DA49D|nr:leucine-rich repeat extensin-like protein 6 [Lolium rigidum]
MMRSTAAVFLAMVVVATPLLASSQPMPAPPAPPTNNSRLEKAYVALQALKRAITEDPKNLTHNWCGPDVCSYYGVYCATAPDDPCARTVASVDLNHGDLAGTLPEELGLLTDLAVFHLNSNRFCGTLPDSLRSLHLLHEIDVSNNQLSGNFPSQLLCLPNVQYVDIRFNNFCGEVPAAVFEKKIDALFINNNHFEFTLSESFSKSTASVIVLANLPRLGGCLPSSIGDMAGTLNELILLNSGISSCIPPEIGKLDKLTVLDLSFNNITGTLPDSIGNMKALEQLNIAHNRLSGEIPESICALPHLKNFTYSNNFFCGEPHRCLEVPHIDDRQNCIAGRPDQRPGEQCIEFLHQPPVHCDAHGCFAPPSPPLPVYAPPPPVY